MKTIKLIFILLLGVAQVAYSAQEQKNTSKAQKITAKTVKSEPTQKNTSEIQTITAKAVKTAPVQKTIPKKYYGSGLCGTTGYYCVRVKKGDNWQKLWPDPIQRHIVQEVNRTDLTVKPGTLIAVPLNLTKITLLDLAPFPKQLKPFPIKMVIVDQDKLAWGAYDRSGKLVNWGAISSGKNYCPDINKPCTTITGEFYVFEKRDKKCNSKIFPVGKGGAIMPYCMFFYRGYALHGSLEVTGFRDSHGCVRMFSSDAEWLNHYFIETPSAANNYLGTKVVIEKLTSFD